MTVPVPVRRVCIESPLRGLHGGKIERNVMYADAAMYHSLRRGEAPFLGHLLYPRVLNDAIELDRAFGIAAHTTWLRAADMIAVYTDLGISDGMRHAIDLAYSIGISVEYRYLGADWREDFLTAAHVTAGFFML